MASFKSLGVTNQVIQGLEGLSIFKPTEIQIQSIPRLIKSPIDFIGMAHTGTGKTAAYSIPIIQNMTSPNQNSSIDFMSYSRIGTIAKQISANEICGKCYVEMLMVVKRQKLKSFLFEEKLTY